jgi:hypothetical protein
MHKLFGRKTKEETENEAKSCDLTIPHVCEIFNATDVMELRDVRVPNKALRVLNWPRDAAIQSKLNSTFENQAFAKSPIHVLNIDSFTVCFLN